MQFWETSKQACIIPTGPAASTSLSQSSPLINTQTPLLIQLSTFYSGIQTFSKTSYPVEEPLIPNLLSFWAIENPGMPFSTRKAVIPLSFSSGLVLAYTTSTSASGPLVIHIFDPFKMYLLPFFSALHLMEVTSDPAPGSDMANAPICYPVHNLGKYLSFCSSLPCRVICARHKALCAPYDNAIDPLALESSSIIMVWAVQLRSEPPYLLGVVGANKPIQPNYRQRCMGNLSVTSVW